MQLSTYEVLTANLAAWDDFWQCREPGTRRLIVHYPLEQGEDGWLTQPLDALREGFHNLPLQTPWAPNDAGTHLLASLLGQDIGCVGESRNNFTIWAQPLASIADVYRLELPNLAVHPYGIALRQAVEAIPRESQTVLPVVCGGGSPIDAAADLLGTMEFFCAFHSDPEALRHLLDLCTQLVIDLYILQRDACANMRGHYGAPGLYVNDLVTEYLSAEHWAEFVLPCYRRLAAAAGGLVLGANAPDPRVLPMVAAIDGFLGCTVHRDVSDETVIACLRGRGVYVIDSHNYDARFDGPTLYRGTYYNPIVAYPSAEYREHCARLADQVALLVSFYRVERDEALADARALL